MISKISNPYHPITILLAELGVQTLDFFFVTGKRTAQTIVFILGFIEQHVHVNFTHQTTWTAIIQPAFATLSHVRSSPFPLTVFLIPRVYIGEKPKPSRKYPEAELSVRMDTRVSICGIIASAFWIFSISAS